MIHQKRTTRRLRFRPTGTSFSQNVDTIYTYQESYRDIMEDDFSLTSSYHSQISTSGRIKAWNPIVGMSLTIPPNPTSRNEYLYHAGLRTTCVQDGILPITPPGKTQLLDMGDRSTSQVGPFDFSTRPNSPCIPPPPSYPPDESTIRHHRTSSDSGVDNVSSLTLPPSLRLTDTRNVCEHDTPRGHRRSRNKAMCAKEFWDVVLKEV